MENTDMPVILFGAFDRHNFGDLLFPHVLTAMLAPWPVQYAGLAARDMRAFGGNEVHALRSLCMLGGPPLTLIHAGGELLTCTAWHAAVMLLPRDRAAQAIDRFDRQPAKASRFARRLLDTEEHAAYMAPRSRLPSGSQIIYNAVGGVELGKGDALLRDEAFSKLRNADLTSVRDLVTYRLVQAAGIETTLAPDCAVMVRELFDERIALQGEKGETRRIRDFFPQGYVAVQFSGEFDDEATLDALAGALDQYTASTGQGIAFFRAGAAPWHDDLAAYQRAAARAHSPAVIFESLDIWDICALIAGCAAYAGSSLHGRIVATAFARPRVSIRPSFPGKRILKQDAFVQTWEMPGMPAVVEARNLAEGLEAAQSFDAPGMRNLADELVARYRAYFLVMRDRCLHA